MNEDTIDDLKQSITATVSQQTQELKNEIKNEVSESEIRLTKKIDDLSASVADALDTSNSTTQ